MEEFRKQVDMNVQIEEMKEQNYKKFFKDYEAKHDQRIH